MEKLIKQIKLKADNCNNSTKESRARKGAYVDCLMMVKEASKNLVQPDVIKSVGNGKNILKALEELRAEFTDEELMEIQKQLPTVL